MDSDLYETWSWPTVGGSSSAVISLSSASATEESCKTVTGRGDCAFAESGGEALAAEYRLLKEGTLKLGAGDTARSGDIVRSEGGPEVEETPVELGLSKGVGVG